MPSNDQAIKSNNRTAVNPMGSIALFLTVTLVSFLAIVMLVIIKQRVYRPFSVWDKY